MVECDRIDRNAYRVLALSGRATASEINHAKANALRAVVLGNTTVESPPLPTLQRTEAMIRAAVGKLENPALRLEERLFWFHGTAWLTGIEDWPATSNVLSAPEIAHDNALRRLIALYAAATAKAEDMVSALRQWHEFVSQPQYWSEAGKVEARGRFEPPAIDREVDRLRSRATALAAEPLERTAREAWANQNSAFPRAYLDALQGLEDTGEWAGKARENFLSQITNQLAEACQTLKVKFRTQLVRSNDAAAVNANVCVGELQYYREFIAPACHRIAAVLPENDADARVARGDAAECLSLIALDHTWTDQRARAEDLAEEAVALSVGTIVEARLREDLRNLLGQATRDIANALAAFAERFAGRLDGRSAGGGVGEQTGKEALRFYRDTVELALNELIGKRTGNLDGWLAWREKAAGCLDAIATQFEMANQFATAEGLLLEAMALAKGAETAVRLQERRARLSVLAQEELARGLADDQRQEAEERVRRHCKMIASTIHNRLNAHAGSANSRVCHDQLVCFRTSVEPALDRALVLSGAADPWYLQMRGEVAVCLAGIAADHTWAGDLLGGQRLIQESFRLSRGTTAAADILEKFLRMQEEWIAQQKKAAAGSSHAERQKRGWIYLGLAAAIGVCAAMLFYVTSSQRIAAAEPPVVQQPLPPPPKVTVTRKPNPPPLFPIPLPSAVQSAAIDPNAQQMKQLQHEIDSLRAARAAGIAIDNLLYNAKLSKLARLRHRRPAAAATVTASLRSDRSFATEARQ